MTTFTPGCPRFRARGSDIRPPSSFPYVPSLLSLIPVRNGFLPGLTRQAAQSAGQMFEESLRRGPPDRPDVTVPEFQPEGFGDGVLRWIVICRGVGSNAPPSWWKSHITFSASTLACVATMRNGAS